MRYRRFLRRPILKPAKCDKEGEPITAELLETSLEWVEPISISDEDKQKAVEGDYFNKSKEIIPK